MKLDTLKELDKLLLLCAKRGVKTMKIDNLEFHLVLPTAFSGVTTTYIDSATDQLKETSTRLQTPGFNDPGPILTTEVRPETSLETDSLTDEQLLYYSAQGHIPVEQ